MPMITKDIIFGILISIICILLKIIDYYYCKINEQQDIEDNGDESSSAGVDCKSNMSFGLLPLPLFFFDNLPDKAQYYNQIRNLLVCIVWVDVLLIVILNLLINE